TDFRRTSATDTSPCVPTQPGDAQPLSICIETRPGEPSFVVDIDGNGINELVVPVRIQSPHTPMRGVGYEMELKALSADPTSPTQRHTGLSSKQMPRMFLDINGDGLTDALHVEDGALKVAMNAGGYFDRPVVIPVSAAAISTLMLPNEMRVGDFNHDGL